MKPGVKTTEFWLALIAAIVFALLSTGVFPVESVAGKVVAIAGLALTALGYGAMRTATKLSADEAKGDDL